MAVALGSAAGIMADPAIEAVSPAASQSPFAPAPHDGGQQGLDGQQSVMTASGRTIPLTSNEDLATAQERLQKEYAAVQLRAQELMSTMDIPGTTRGCSSTLGMQC